MSEARRHSVDIPLSRNRHSVDIPLSRTLVALKRVRSLRDPSMNPISNFGASVDNLSWETGSCNGVSLNLENHGEVERWDNHGIRQSRNSRLYGEEEEHGTDPGLGYSLRRPKSRHNCCNNSARIGRTERIDELGLSRSSVDGIYENPLSGGRESSNHRSKPLDLTWLPHSDNHLKEEIESYSESNVDSARSRSDAAVTKRNSAYGKLVRSTVEDVIRSRLHSPCQSESDARMDGLSISPSLFTKDEVDAVGSNSRGCGISRCWSGTPTDVEDHPLLSSEGQSSAYFKRELALSSSNPRSLSEKFRPRFFHELVGQRVVTQSLLSAIAKGKIASFYLFHGPRGTGKTATSRIFAAALNCISLEENRPCGYCRECLLFFSGRVRDVKEVDAAKINRTGRVKSLFKSAALPPVSSRFKIFIVDECQLLRGEVWASLLNNIEELPRHVIFIMVTPDLDKLPRGAISRCQRYHFPKIRDADIVSRLQVICEEEGLDSDTGALEFVATKSNGSLRDAEMMLDQLSLLGKRITTSLAYELNGIVSDDELLDLLDLALSSDTSNTVKRARELMRSRIDPMQLISQLANLIMDILAGRCDLGSSGVGKKFFGKPSFAEADLQKLRHALKILSETEKQLRTSKNQTTWLTVALLQFSAGESSGCLRDDGLRSTSSPVESMKHSFPYALSSSESYLSDVQNDASRKLDTLWRRAMEKCQSNRLGRFLQREGKLLSICVNQGVAIAVVEFRHLDHVSRAEKSWKVIASSLQLVLGRNVEIRIKFCPTRNVKVKKPSCSFLSCSGRVQENSASSTVNGNDHSDGSAFPSEKTVDKETPSGAYLLDQGCQFSAGMQPSYAKEVHNMTCFPPKDTVTIRNTEGNALQTGTTTPSVRSDLPGCRAEVDSLKEMDTKEYKYLGIQEPETQPSCFSKTLNLKRILHPYDAACTICLRIQPNNKVDLSIPEKASLDTYFSTNDPYIISSGSNAQITRSKSSRDEDVRINDSRVNTKIHCWRAPKFPIRKVWLQQRQHQKKSQLVGWVLPCSTTKKFSTTE